MVDSVEQFGVETRLQGMGFVVFLFFSQAVVFLFWTSELQKV